MKERNFKMGKTNISISNLVIEVTRKCNLNCAHCLRGKSEDMVFDTAMLPNIFENVEYVSSITFTGGEPSLYPDVIRQTLEHMKENNISLGFFFIATNATFYSQDFIFVILDLYAYCEEKEYCNLSVSIDQYHTSLNDKAYSIYTAFKFYSDMKEHENGFDDNQLLNRGNAYENGLGSRNNVIKNSFTTYSYSRYNNDVSIDDCIYVSSNGMVTLDCDLSYDMIDEPEYHIGNVQKESLKSILLREIEKAEKEDTVA